jgi:teichuronopeptide biosynthesis TupA-like protein
MSGNVMIIRGDEFDRDEIKGWFDLDHYLVSREPNYRHWEPKIIVEPIILGQSDVTDFRIFCFRGKAKIICLDIGKYSNYCRAFYSLNRIRHWGIPFTKGIFLGLRILLR